MIAQVNDRKLIILANEYISNNPNFKVESYIDFLRDKCEGKFKPRSDRYNDAVKSYRYVLKMKQDNIPEEKWMLHSKPVYPEIKLLEIVPPVQNSPKRILEDDEIISAPLKKRKIESSSDKANIREYLMNFVSEPDDECLKDIFPFPKKLEEDITTCLNLAQLTDECRIILKGNSLCGKTTFIKYIAKKFNYNHVYVKLSKITQFDTDTFWSAVKNYLKDNNYDKVLLHFKLDLCTRKCLSNFKLERPINFYGRVVIIYECVNTDDIDKWSDFDLVFPGIQKNDRYRMFEFLLNTLQISDDLSYEMLAKWTPGFELGNIKSLVSRFKHSHSDQFLTKDFAETIIKDFKSKIALTGLCIGSPNVSWDNIGGHENVKAKLNAITNALLDDNEPPKQSGVLLYGPPGCGKTMLAKALATELEFNFISVCCSDILSRYQGDSEKNVKDVFNKARSSQPCILFFDEFDALCSKRDHDNSGSKNNIVNVFLTQLDGMNSHKNSRILVLGSTNFEDRIDDAVTRYGRLGEHIEIPLPQSPQQRFSVLMAASNYGNKPRFITNVNDEENDVTLIFTEYSLDEYTKGWSHADLAELISRSEILRKTREDQIILMKHVQSAYSEINDKKKKKSSLMQSNRNNIDLSPGNLTGLAEIISEFISKFITHEDQILLLKHVLSAYSEMKRIRRRKKSVRNRNNIDLS